MFFVSSVIIQLISVAIFFIVFIKFFILIRKKNKNVSKENSFKTTISNANNEKEVWNSVSGESTDVTCSYCNSRYPKIKKRCPSCGAKNDNK